MEWVQNQTDHKLKNVINVNGELMESINGVTQQLSKESEYWLAVDCVMFWVKGMYDSLKKSGSVLTYDQFIALPYMADLEDILNKFSKQEDFIGDDVSICYSNLIR